ncbi:hypothetical protein ACLOJK_006175 [Asimina triloba]
MSRDALMERDNLTIWQVELEKPHTATLTSKGQEVVFKVMINFFNEGSLKWFATRRSYSLESLEGDMVLKKFVLTLKEAAKLEVHKRRVKGVTSKRSLISVKEEAGLVTIKESTEKRRWWVVKEAAKAVKEERVMQRYTFK